MLQFKWEKELLDEDGGHLPGSILCRMVESYGMFS